MEAILHGLEKNIFFSSVFFPLTYNGQKNRNIQGGSAMILKIYFPVHKLPLTYNGEEKQLFPKIFLKKPLFFSNPSTYNGIDKRHF